MKKTALFSVIGFGMLAMANAAHADSTTVCVPNAGTSAYVNNLVQGMEVGIVITDSNDKPYVKANNFYGNGAGTYWTSKLPDKVTLQAGCSNIYIMSKTTPPDTTVQWTCDGLSAMSSAMQSVVIGIVPQTTIETGTVTVTGQTSSTKINTGAACPSGGPSSS